MAITHIVLFKLKPEAKANPDAFLNESKELLKKVPIGTDRVMGPPIWDKMTGGFDLALTCKFNSEQEFMDYRNHPDHMAVITGPVKQNVAEMVSYQIKDGKL